MRILTRLFSPPLAVRKIEENNVILNDLEPLWGFKLASLKEESKTIKTELLENLRSMCFSASKTERKYNNYLYLVFYKKRVGEFSDLEVYFFAREKDIANFIKGTLNVVPLDGISLTNALLRIQTLSEDLTVLKDKKIVREIEIFSDYFLKKFDEKERFKTLESSFYSATERAYLKVLNEKLTEREIAYYVGALPLETELVNLDKILYDDWEGALWVILNLNDITSFLRDRLKYIPLEDQPPYMQILKEYERGNVPLLGMWVYFATSADTDMTKIEPVFSALSLKPLKISYQIGDYVWKTPLKVRDPDYMLVKKTEYASKIIVDEYRKFYKHPKPMVYGKDRFGIYVNLDLFDKRVSSNQHACLIGRPGTGKSFTLENIVKQVLNIDAEKLYKGLYSPKEIGERVRGIRVRYFDKGFSAELFFKLLKERGFPVGLGAIRVEDMLFNPVEINPQRDLQSQIEFAVTMINTILEASNIDPLDGFERAKVASILQKFATNPEKFAITAKTIYLTAIERSYSEDMKMLRPFYRKILEVAKEKKVPPEKIKSLTIFEAGKLLGLKNFTVPTVADMHNIVLRLKNLPDVSNEERKTLESLTRKLEVVKNTPFGYFSLLDIELIEPYSLFYLDIEELMNSQYFTAFILALLQRMLEKDKYDKTEEEKVLYIFDEVHNLFRIEEFRKFLTRLTLELRRFGIALIFASQNPEHFPPEVLSALDTHIILDPRESDLAKYSSQLKGGEDIEIKDVETIEKVIIPSLKMSSERYIIVRGTQQLFTLSLPISKYDLIVLDTSRHSLELPDGKVIKKELFVK